MGSRVADEDRDVEIGTKREGLRQKRRTTKETIFPKRGEVRARKLNERISTNNTAKRPEIYGVFAFLRRESEKCKRLY